MPIICEGCGQRVPIPEDYRRKKIQCPACGVICPVPEDALREAAASAPERPGTAKQTPAAPPEPAEEEEARWLLDEEPAPAPRAEAAAAPERDDGRPPPQKAVVTEMRFRCRRCGRLVRRQGECSSCNPETAPPPPLRLSLDDPDEETEDSSPYLIEGPPDVHCPKCQKLLPSGGVLCLSCGYHLKKRKKAVKTYQPLDRVWETNASCQKRLAAFWACEVLFLALGLTGVFVAGADLGVFVGSFALLTAMMAFLLGTFDRIHLTRDARGRVKLTRTWRFCFWVREPQPLDVRGHGGVGSGRSREVSMWEYLVCFFLFISGIIPGIIWYYYAIHKVTFHVSLTRDHGYPAVLVYQGWDQMQMKEIAYTLRDALGLPHDAG